MKRYRFAFETVLRARRAQEDLARQELARANHRLAAATAAHHLEMQRHRDATEAPGWRDGPTFRAEVDAGDRRAAVVAAAGARRAEAEQEARRRLDRWAAAAQDVAILERLDERRRREWELEAGRAEVAAVDDISSSRWLADERDEESVPAEALEAAP